MRHLILIRHGQSQVNALNQQARTFCGQLDTPLTQRGREQAREAGQLLANLAGVQVGYCVSSALERARDTAAAIIEQLPYSVQLLPATADLNERSLGIFEGRTEEEVFREYPQYRDDERFNRFQADFVQQAPGGENLTDVTQRAWSAVERLLATTSGDLLVVSHCNTIRCLLGRALALSESEIPGLRVNYCVPIVLRQTTTFELVDLS